MIECLFQLHSTIRGHIVALCYPHQIIKVFISLLKQTLIAVAAASLKITEKIP